MRILLVSNLYAPEARGGAEAIAKMIAEGLAKEKHDVTVLTTTARKIEGLDEATGNGVRVLRYRPRLPYHLLEDAEQPLWRRFLWHKLDLVPFGCERKMMARIIEDVKPDLILTHNLRGMRMCVVRAIRSSGVPWTHTLHDIQLLIPSGQYWFDRAPLWQWNVVTKPFQWWTRWLMRSPHIVVGPTEYIINEHRRAGLFARSTTRVIRNPVADVPVMHRVNDGAHDPLRLACVGQLTVHKGVHVLLEALKGVDGRVRLDVYGDGAEKTALMNQASQLPATIDVRFRGKVPHAELLNELTECDALVFPSIIVENCPGAVLEAVAVGLPVIGSKVGGVPELIDPSGLVSPANPHALADKINALRRGEVRATVDAVRETVPSYIDKLIHKDH